jgi:hypothetical protein
MRSEAFIYSMYIAHVRSQINLRLLETSGLVISPELTYE